MEEQDKRYLVFTYDTYYPFGGISDLINSFDTIEEAKKAVEENKKDHATIYDRIMGVIIDN